MGQMWSKTMPRRIRSRDESERFVQGHQRMLERREHPLDPIPEDLPTEANNMPRSAAEQIGEELNQRRLEMAGDSSLMEVLSRPAEEQRVTFQWFEDDLQPFDPHIEDSPLFQGTITTTFLCPQCGQEYKVEIEIQNGIVRIIRYNAVDSELNESTEIQLSTSDSRVLDL